jgi:hypothetical protein
MKRLAPFVLIAALAAAVLAALRSSDEHLPEETWKPVQPS